ncbi:hypothetical protein [Brumicola pallidula]|nr:hypothetical protein [Glaciecola pallidula]
MLRRIRQTSRRMFIAFVALIISQSLFAKSLVVSIVDRNGTAVPNAVISFPQIKATTQANMAIMDQVNKQFAPRVLIIQKNQMVDFPNSDDIRHHVYSFSRPKQFEIKLFSDSEAQPVAFENPGIVALGCNIHDNKIGYIYVNDGELTAMTDNKGDAFVALPKNASTADTVEINIWHSQLSPLQTDRVIMQLPINIENQRITLSFSLDIETPEIETGFRKKFGD